jgi:hypothetical protein
MGSVEQHITLLMHTSQLLFAMRFWPEVACLERSPLVGGGGRGDVGGIYAEVCKIHCRLGCVFPEKPLTNKTAFQREVAVLHSQLYEATPHILPTL